MRTDSYTNSCKTACPSVITFMSKCFLHGLQIAMFFFPWYFIFLGNVFK